MLKGGLLTYSLGKKKQTKEAKTVRNKLSREHLSGYSGYEKWNYKPLPIEMSPSLTERSAQPPIQIQLQV